MTLRSSLWKWFFFGCAMVILVLALMPSMPHGFTTGWDKSNHMLAFAVLTWLGCSAFPRRFVLMLTGLLAYGGLIEVLQSFTPTRTADLHDLFADSLGILAGWALIRMKEWIVTFRPQ